MGAWHNESVAKSSPCKHGNPIWMSVHVKAAPPAPSVQSSAGNWGWHYSTFMSSPTKTKTKTKKEYLPFKIPNWHLRWNAFRGKRNLGNSVTVGRDVGNLWGWHLYGKEDQTQSRLMPRACVYRKRELLQATLLEWVPLFFCFLLTLALPENLPAYGLALLLNHLKNTQQWLTLLNCSNQNLNNSSSL